MPDAPRNDATFTPTRKHIYKAVINYMANDLKIDSEQIRQWVQEAVNRQVTAYFKSGDFDKFLGEQIRKELRTWQGDDRPIRNALRDRIAEEVKYKLNLKISIGELGNND